MAPLVFVAHSLTDLFWTVNATALLITVFVVLAYGARGSAGAAVLLVAWLSFLMLVNAMFHIAGAIVDHGYVPGLVTAIFLYLPYCAWVARQVGRTRRMAPGLLAAAAVIGGMPMAVHGYRILFLGTRLF